MFLSLRNLLNFEKLYQVFSFFTLVFSPSIMTMYRNGYVKVDGANVSQEIRQQYKVQQMHFNLFISSSPKMDIQNRLIAEIQSRTSVTWHKNIN